MLTFAMATREEGPDFELSLAALAQASGPSDRLLVFHFGDDQTLSRLQRFSERHPARIIQTDSPIEEPIDLLRLALAMAETAYTLILSPTDRLQPDALESLRITLELAAPDLCLLHSAWWLADAKYPLPRSDSAAFEKLPLRPSPEECSDLLPDPRRLLFRTRDWRERFNSRPLPDQQRDFYETILSDSAELLVARSAVLLHLHTPKDPTPTLQDFCFALSNLPKSERATGLDAWSKVLDEALTLCPPEKANSLLRTLPKITALLPRSARKKIAHRTGVFAHLLAAQITEGSIGAKVALSLQLSEQQQRRSNVLAASYGRLRADLDLALPGPEYLQALYTRIRAF